MCDCCGKPIGQDGFCRWEGPPFSQRATRELCYTCLSAIRPIVLRKSDDDPGIAIVGTSAGDVYSLAEMLADGFDEVRATASIKSIGKVLGIPPNIMKLRLQKPKEKKLVRKKPTS